MKMNLTGIDLIKEFEGLKLKAYPDPATGGKPYTIGYGHTGSDVTPTTVWTKARADFYLITDISRVTMDISSCLEDIHLSDNEFSALVCLTFNIGIGNFKKSTLLKLLLQSADKTKVANQFSRWNKAAGKVMAGLTRRRMAEKKLFLS